MIFDVNTLLDAAERLDGTACAATRQAREHEFTVSFEGAMRAVISA